MKNQEACPVCGGRRVTVLATETVKVVHPPSRPEQAETNAILECVVRKESVTTDTVLCATCRHIYVSPTFDEAEIKRLYSGLCHAAIQRQYKESERVTGKTWTEQYGVNPQSHDSLLAAARRYRPRRMYDLVVKATKRVEFPKICDFGCGSGELTSVFTGSQRFAYDTDPKLISDGGVIPLSSFDEFASHGPYDLLVLSHLLEHAPDPTDLLRSLQLHMKQGGAIYVEVPLQYCGALVKKKSKPIAPHVQFFSRASFARCLTDGSRGRIALMCREVAPYDVFFHVTLKAVVTVDPNGSENMWPIPWPVDLMIDSVLMVKSRRWPSRY